jgi:hypothetical protein
LSAATKSSRPRASASVSTASPRWVGIELGTERHEELAALVGTQGVGDRIEGGLVVIEDGIAVDRLEVGGIARVADLAHHRGDVRIGHLDRVEKRQLGLVLYEVGTAVAELAAKGRNAAIAGGNEGRRERVVHQAGRVARAEQALDHSLGGGASARIAEGRVEVVAAGARLPFGLRKIAVEEDEMAHRFFQWHVWTFRRLRRRDHGQGGGGRNPQQHEGPHGVLLGVGDATRLAAPARAGNPKWWGSGLPLGAPVCRPSSWSTSSVARFHLLEAGALWSQSGFDRGAATSLQQMGSA